MCFQPNAADKIPLMTILSQDREDSAIKLFKFMDKSGTDASDGTGVISQKLEGVLSMTDKRKENIFHVCSSNGKKNFFWLSVSPAWPQRDA